jgi:hypothetical protein
MAGNANFNEIGYPIRINLGFDITATTPTLVLLPEIGKKKDLTNGVTIPNVSVIVGDETLIAGEYIEYLTKDGDFDYTGRWKFKAKLDFSPTEIRYTDYQKFRVLA